MEELETRSSVGLLTRIYTTEEIRIPAGQQARATWPGLYALVASLILKGKDVRTVVRVMNLSSKDRTLRNGAFVTEAERVEIEKDSW